MEAKASSKYRDLKKEDLELSKIELVLGMNLVSLRPGTGHQFPGTSADQPSCLQDSQFGSQANFRYSK